MLFPAKSFAQEGEGLRGVKPPVALPSEFVFLWIALGIITAVVLAYFLVRFFVQRAKKKVVVPALPPHVIALQRLEGLRAQNLPAAGKIKEYYSILSDIVRRYLEDRFALRAPEMTTEEFLFSLRYSTQLTSVHKGSLKDFLESCDLVKFAKYHSTVDEMEYSFLLAKKVIEETKLVESHV
jgi:hypothetical protein